MFTRKTREEEKEVFVISSRLIGKACSAIGSLPALHRGFFLVGLSFFRLLVLLSSNGIHTDNHTFFRSFFFSSSLSFLLFFLPSCGVLRRPRGGCTGASSEKARCTYTPRWTARTAATPSDFFSFSSLLSRSFFLSLLSYSTAALFAFSSFALFSFFQKKSLLSEIFFSLFHDPIRVVRAVCTPGLPSLRCLHSQGWSCLLSHRNSLRLGCGCIDPVRVQSSFLDEAASSF